MRSLFVLLTVAACGGKPAGPAIAMLPGDGDTHVAKPTPPKAVESDPWTARNDLVPAPTRPAAPAPIALPKIEALKLANGLQVYVVKNDRLPVVAMQLAIKAGRMHEPRARLGVSELTADMLVKGTTRRDAAGLARAIDAVGGTIAADATFEATLVSCSALARSVSTCFELLPEMITQSTFPEPELARLRDALSSSVRQRLSDPGTVASAHAQNLLWGADHVRGWVSNAETLSAIRRDDLLAWHRAWFVPSNALLVITGDVDVRRLKGDLERTFGAWRKGPVPPAPTYPEQGLSGSRIRLVDKPNETYAQIRIAQFGIKHDDPRFFDTLVWNYALGAGPRSRLGRALRQITNETYDVASTFDRNLDRGSLVLAATTRNASVVAVTKQMEAEVAKLAKDGPTQDEIDAAAANVIGNYGMRFQTSADVGASIVGAELHGFGREYLTNFPLAVGGVSVADAKRAASEILSPKAFVVVIVGDAKELEPQLKAAGWRYETVPFAATITPPVAGPQVPDKPVDAAAAAAARKLIDDALAAKGGKAKLAAIKALRMIASGTTTIQGQALPVEIVRVVAMPDRMRIDATIKPPGSPKDVLVSVGATGAAGWQRGPDPKTGGYAVVDITGDAMSDIAFERWRDPELILLKAADANAKLVPLPDETIDGKAYSVISLPTPFGIAVALYIDKKTKLIGRMSYRDARTSENDDFADYREVAGVKFAFKRSTMGAGRSTTLEVKAIEVDPAIEATLFDKPGKPAGAPPVPAPAAKPPASVPAPAAKPPVPAPAAKPTPPASK